MSEGFLPKKGNYRGLIVYQKAECIYDITFYFANRYMVARKDRIVDQMVQSARSAKQNIAEGCAAAATSAETELKLIGVARASMKELLTDYEDYLRTRHLLQWPLRLLGPRGLSKPRGLSAAIAAIAAIALAACSAGGGADDEALQEQGAAVETPICFNSGLAETDDITRSTALSSVTTSFTVWAYKNMSATAGSYGDKQLVMDDYTVRWTSGSANTSTTNTSGWEYVGQGSGQTVKYWDWSAKAYRFFGVAGTHGTHETADAYELTMLADASDIAAAPYYSQLWFSTGAPGDYPTRLFGRPVRLEFLKPFVRVRFLFTFSYPDRGITLTDQRFAPTSGAAIATSGTVTVSFPLTGTDTREHVSVSDVTASLTALTEDYEPDDDAKVYTLTDGGWYTLLPATSQGSFTLSVTINGEPKTAVVPAEYMQWQPGYEYTYIFKINDEGGVEIDMVQGAFTPWSESTTNHEFYNW